MDRSQLQYVKLGATAVVQKAAVTQCVAEVRPWRRQETSARAQKQHGPFEDLVQAVARLINDDPERTFRLDPADGEALAWLYRNGRVTDREDGGAAVLVTARLDSQALGRFEQLRPGLTPALDLIAEIAAP